MLSQVKDRLIGPGRAPEEVAMRKLHSFRPALAGALEDRVVLSHVGALPPVLVNPQVPPPAPPVAHALALNGTLSGIFVTTIRIGTNSFRDIATNFQGSGTITGLGAVAVTGSMTTLESPTSVPSTAESFTLTAAQGSITIEISSSPRALGANSTSVSSFSIVKATGAFQGDSGAGTADLQLNSEAINVTPPTVAKGTFTLTLHSNAPALNASAVARAAT
jgi:hypothetical protein